MVNKTQDLLLILEIRLELGRCLEKLIFNVSSESLAGFVVRGSKGDYAETFY